MNKIWIRKSWKWRKSNDNVSFRTECHESPHTRTWTGKIASAVHRRRVWPMAPIVAKPMVAFVEHQVVQIFVHHVEHHEWPVRRVSIEHPPQLSRQTVSSTGVWPLKMRPKSWNLSNRIVRFSINWIWVAASRPWTIINSSISFHILWFKLVAKMPSPRFSSITRRSSRHFWKNSIFHMPSIVPVWKRQMHSMLSLNFYGILNHSLIYHWIFIELSLNYYWRIIESSLSLSI